MTKYTIWNKKTHDVLPTIYTSKTAAEQAIDDLYKHLELTGMNHMKGLLAIIDIEKMKQYI